MPEDQWARRLEVEYEAGRDQCLHRRRRRCQPRSRSGDGGAIIGPFVARGNALDDPVCVPNAAEIGREIEFLTVNAGFGPYQNAVST